MLHLMDQDLQRQIEVDRLRMWGHRSRVERRHRDLRALVGNALIGAGEKVRGATRQAAPLRRA